MPRFTPDFIDKVRSANSIVEIIGQYTELKGNGSRRMGRCPFPDHSDKSPSFSVTEDIQTYFCFGCKKTGNVYTFLQTFNGMSFPEAVEFLARRASIALPERTEYVPRPGESREDREELLRVNKITAVYYHHLLKGLDEDHPAKQYLAKRGMTQEIVDKFRIGVSSDEWQGLLHALESRKVPLALPEKLGLIKPKKNAKPGDAYFDLFRERLMFPIFSPTEDVVGFGGRTLGDALPKYVNSSDSPVFSKGKILYGLHETGKYIRAQDHAIVVEGYMDAISLYAAGVQNVVAILGTAFTPEHAKLLKRYTLNVTMLLDGDDAGVSGAERSLPILLAAGLMPKGFVLPEKQDPDDFVKAHGGAALKAAVEKAPELYLMLLKKQWMKSYRGSASDKVRVLEDAQSALRAMQNQQLQDLYIIETASELDVEVGWVRKALAQATQNANAAHARMAPHTVEKPMDEKPVEEIVEDKEFSKIILKDAPRDESFVLSLLLHNEALLRDLISAGTDEVLMILSHEGVRQALRLAIERYTARPAEFKVLVAALISNVDDPSKLTSSLSVQAQTVSEASIAAEQRVMIDYLQAIRSRFLKNQGKILAELIKDGAEPATLEKFMSVQRDRMGSGRSDEDNK